MEERGAIAEQTPNDVVCYTVANSFDRSPFGKESKLVSLAHNATRSFCSLGS